MDEISSEEKVVLIAENVEVHIVFFKSRAALLKKFCITLRSTMSASSPRRAMSLGSGTLIHPQSRPRDPGDMIIRGVVVGVTRLSLFMRLDPTQPSQKGYSPK